jgi:hypothetical protein
MILANALILRRFSVSLTALQIGKGQQVLMKELPDLVQICFCPNFSDEKRSDSVRFSSEAGIESTKEHSSHVHPLANEEFIFF